MTDLKASVKTFVEVPQPKFTFSRKLRVETQVLKIRKSKSLSVYDKVLAQVSDSMIVMQNYEKGITDFVHIS